MIQGCGIDLVEISRIERVLDRFGWRFLDRVFTPAEKEYCLAKKRPAESLAARFAAKEAVAKTLGLGLGQFCWQDIEIMRPNGGRPQVRLKGAAWDEAEVLGVGQILVSISHTHQYAVAQAVAIV